MVTGITLIYLLTTAENPDDPVNTHRVDPQTKVLSCTLAPFSGVAHLNVKGYEIRLNHDDGHLIESSGIQLENAFPTDGGFHAEVRNSDPGILVGVIQQPNLDNGFELELLISSAPGAAPESVAFDIYAVPTPPLKHPYNVVIITVDTLRADRLGCYGYSRPTSPNLDRFASQAVRFSNAFSTASFTPPAHASLFTSKYVADHGLLSWNQLPQDQLTLAEVLQSCGYVTAASVNLALLSHQNLGQGFGLRSEGLRDGKEIIVDAQNIIRTSFGAPFMLWLHFYDVHRPYGGPAEWAKRFNPDGRDGVGEVEAHYNLQAASSPNEGYSLAESGLDQVDLEFIADRYDAGIAYLDSLLGPLLDELSTPRRLEDTLIIFTSDHGENLMEHTECMFTHDPFLYSVVTRIPLLIRYPTAREVGTTSETLVSLVDVAPTVMDLIGLPAPTSFQAGRSLLPLLEGDQEWPDSHRFMECWGWSRLAAVRSKDYLIIHDATHDQVRTFDLATDTAELQPLQPPPAEAAQLQQALDDFTKREGADAETPSLAPETLEELRSLGYIQ